MKGEELQVKGNPLTVEEIAALFEARVSAALEAPPPPAAEVAEPQSWWNLFALGPIQPDAVTIPGGGLGGGPAVLPHKIIQMGQKAYIVALIWLNPHYGVGGLTACNILSVAEFEYSVELLTVHVNSMSSTASVPLTDRFTPHQCAYVKVFEIEPHAPGIYEVHMTARIHNAKEVPMAPFAAFATQVFDFDEELFAPTPQGPHWNFDTPIRYMVYK